MYICLFRVTSTADVYFIRLSYYELRSVVIAQLSIIFLHLITYNVYFIQSKLNIEQGV